jgi:hypothetical protein
MPKAQTEAKIKELVAKYGFHTGTEDMPSVLENIIDNLAVFYEVSKQAAKIRFIGLGYPEANSVYNFTDGCFLIQARFRLPPYITNTKITESSKPFSIWGFFAT